MLSVTFTYSALPLMLLKESGNLCVKANSYTMLQVTLEGTVRGLGVCVWV